MQTEEVKGRRQGPRKIDPVLSAKRRAAALARHYGTVEARQRIVKKAIADAPKAQGVQSIHTGLIQQPLARLTAIADIIKALPEAAGYLIRLVKGVDDCANAPHAVRRQAAVDLLEYGGVRINPDKDDDDLPSMTRSAILKEINSINHAIAAKGAEDAQEVAQADPPAEVKGVDIDQLA